MACAFLLTLSGCEADAGLERTTAEETVGTGRVDAPAEPYDEADADVSELDDEMPSLAVGAPQGSVASTSPTPDVDRYDGGEDPDPPITLAWRDLAAGGDPPPPPVFLESVPVADIENTSAHRLIAELQFAFDAGTNRLHRVHASPLLLDPGQEASVPLPVALSSLAPGQQKFSGRLELVARIRPVPSEDSTDPEALLAWIDVHAPDQYYHADGSGVLFYNKERMMVDFGGGLYDPVMRTWLESEPQSRHVESSHVEFVPWFPGTQRPVVEVYND